MHAFVLNHSVVLTEAVFTISWFCWLSIRCRINAGRFDYAGTKDRRGKTAQEVTVHRFVSARYRSTPVYQLLVNLSHL